MHFHKSLFLCCAFRLPTCAYPTRESISEPVPPRVCGTGPPSGGLRSAHRKLHARHRLHSRQTQTSSLIAVDTYVHFVTTDDQAPFYNANVISTLIGNQVAVLNTAYAQANISFRLLAPSYTVKNTWATDTDSNGMKASLRNGSYAALNLYFQTNLSTPSATPSDVRSLLLGYCTLPSPRCPNPPCMPNTPNLTSPYLNDGCNILAGSLPGGSVPGYNMGGTAVHEVGHWFGLLHTFQGESCAPADPGDYVDDTKQEASQTVGCPVGKDTCPLLVAGGGGGDPVWDFMDYSSDVCYTRFTPGQNARMQSLFRLLRFGL